MATVLEMLQQFLCYGNQQCIQEFSQYAYQPMEGIFYAVFFPIVFIIIFIFILSGMVGSMTRGIRLLVAVAVFAFIILQGWYYYFLILGRLWLYTIIFLGVFWAILHTFLGRGGGGGAGGGGARGRSFGGGALGGALTKRLKNQMSGKVRTSQQALDRAIKAAEGIIARVNKGDTQAYRGISAAIVSVEESLKAYREIVGVEGFTVGGEYRKMEERASRVIEQLSGSRGKYDKKQQG